MRRLNAQPQDCQTLDVDQLALMQIEPSFPGANDKVSSMGVIGRLLFVSIAALASLGAMSEQRADQPTPDKEIRIGNIVPYSGPLSEFGAIGKAEAAYFDMVNDRGGINGRKIRFITRDDNSDPAAALNLTRDLVEKDDVHLMFGSFGTPGNIATRWYLNEKKIPQLFVASGGEELSPANAFPWTLGWQPPVRSDRPAQPGRAMRCGTSDGSVDWGSESPRPFSACSWPSPRPSPAAD